MNPEEIRKSKSRKRLFWLFIVCDLALVSVIVWQIVIAATSIK